MPGPVQVSLSLLSFGISPLVAVSDAEQDPAPLDYLKQPEPRNYDIHLQVQSTKIIIGMCVILLCKRVTGTLGCHQDGQV